jgi:hypothetical protein
MHTPTTATLYSLIRLPSVHAAMEDFHKKTLEWLARAPSLFTSRIHRATLTATIAVSSAALGNGSRERQVARAKAAIIPCHQVFRLLCMGGHVNAVVFDEARRRIDQILAGLDVLAKVSIEKWPELELASLEAAAEGTGDLNVSEAEPGAIAENHETATAETEDYDNAVEAEAEGLATSADDSDRGDLEPPDR